MNPLPELHPDEKNAEKRRVIKLKPTITRRIVLSVAGLMFLGCIMSTIYFLNPEHSLFYPGCIIYKLTGLYCPGCGSTRATYWLLHGEIIKALRYNALFVTALPLIMIYSLNSIFKKFTGREISRLPSLPRKVLWIAVIVVVVFGILRNIPLKPFNLLAP